MREFHRASSERVFPRLLPCDLLTNKCAAAVNFFFLFFIPLLLARSPATTTAAVAQSLTTDSPVTQLNFHSFRLCMLRTPVPTLCVSFITPHHPLVSLLRCIEYSEEQHPRLLQHLHRRQDVGREEVKYATTAVAGQDIMDVRPLQVCMLLLFFVRANT